MGKYSDFKLPKPKLPDFKQQAEKGLERATGSIQLPDFMGIASEKVNSIKAKIENPDLNEINALIDKLSVSKNVVKAANALGINISEDQINAVIEKKNELESAVAEKSFGAVEKFMSKEGYPIEKPDMNDIASRLSGGEDPLQVGKEAAKPFTTMAKDVFSGEHTISGKNITSSISSSSSESSVKNKATELMDSVEKLYFSTKIDQKALTAARNGDTNYNMDHLDEDTALRTKLVILADPKVSSKFKDQIEEKIKADHPDISKDELYKIRSGKYNDSSIAMLGSSSNIALLKEEIPSVIDSIKDAGSPIIETGKELLSSAKNVIPKVDTSAANNTFNMLKDSAAHEIQATPLLEGLREKEREREEQKANTEFDLWMLKHGKIDFNRSANPEKELTRGDIIDLITNPDIPENIRRMMIDNFNGGN